MMTIQNEPDTSLLDRLPLPVWIYNLSTLEILYANCAFKKHYGYSSKEIYNLTIKDLRPPEEVDKLLSVVHLSLSEYEKIKFWKHRKKNGNDFFVETYNNEILYNGLPARIVIAKPIQADEQEKEYLDNYNKSLKNFFEDNMLEKILFSIEKNASCGTWVADVEGKLLYMSKSYMDLLGIDFNDIKGFNWAKCIEIENSDSMLEKWKNCVETKNYWSYQYRILNKTGEYTSLLSRASRIKSGDKIYWVGIHMDITERQKMKEALVQKNKEYDTILNRINDSFLALDKNWNIIYANDKTFRPLDHGSDLIGKNIWEIFPALAGTEIENNFKSSMLKQEPCNFIHAGILRPGKWYKYFVYPSDDGITVYSQDYTAIIEAEEKLKKSLAEKELLIKETHHRVKNNLQLVSSLIHLQSNFISSSDPSETFKILEQRVGSIALLHEHLYRSASLNSINIGIYISNLLAHIRSSYDTSASGIDYNIDIEEMEFDLNTSINIGIIINELVTNSLKHAFKDRKSGVISISLKKQETNYELIIKDDGIGLPPEFKISGLLSLGLQLVDTLIDQLNGTLQLSSNGETQYKISFELH